jgi:hypothetical protein
MNIPIALTLALDHSSRRRGSSKDSESSLHCASTRKNEWNENVSIGQSQLVKVDRFRA